MFDLKSLSEEERAEYEAAMYDAIVRPDGSTRPTGEAGHRLHADLISRGYAWGELLIEAIAIKGLGTRVHKWAKEQQVVETLDGEEKLVAKSALMSTKRRQAESGALANQLILWADATRDDLHYVVRRDTDMILGLRVEVSTAARLLGLLDKYDVATVGQALQLEGVSLEDFLARAA